MEENKKKIFNKWWLFDLLGIALISFLVLFLAFVFPHLRNIISDFLSWLSLSDFYETPDNFLNLPILEQEKYARYSQVTRNRGWFIWTIISLVGLTITLILTIWGKIIQKEQLETQKLQWEVEKLQWETQNETHELQLKSHLQERYEKAASMLESEVRAVRIAGCRALSDLGIDESMKIGCVRLLFSFIRNPYIEEREKEKEFVTVRTMGNMQPDRKEHISKDEFFKIIFPIDEPLRDDIQEAADSFSAIYEHHDDTGTYIEKVILPDYFLQNEKKKPISLIKADLPKIDFEDAYLEMVKLQGADLVNANLIDAKLMFADMSGANLIDAEFIRANLDQADLSNAKLHGANLSSVQLFNADLSGANFSHANLYKIELYGANLSDAKLNGANISNASMHRTTGLTKEQILLAKWGINESGEGEPPSFLPEELADDPEVKKWLAKPHFDESKKEGD